MLFNNKAARPATSERAFRVSPDRPKSLIQHCPAYVPTPLADMPSLALELGARRVWVKDETARMGLGSFKALGGVFAVARILCDLASTDDPCAPKAKTHAAGLTFITATAGNHGLSVATGARIFGAQSVIVLDASVSEDFADRIRAAGGTVERVAGSYEDAVVRAQELAEGKGGILLADGSWEGYIGPPALVMEGYTVLADECRARFAELGDWPTHVLLQAGVGGLAGAVAAHIRMYWSVQPHITVVEPEAADCLMRSARAERLVHAEGPVSNMGRLDCKDASLIAFDSLRFDANAFVTVSDGDAEAAVALFARHGIRTTPSGAAGLAALVAMPLPADATCMVVASEGRAEDIGTLTSTQAEAVST